MEHMTGIKVAVPNHEVVAGASVMKTQGNACEVRFEESTLH